ncbi:hypothetical protein CXB51_004070 [Gossypium anomalum]|uniref:CCHC-type domain-containing protein n=1 Tax=Gossypium anomalum TaxID=47600 RepID=A0A8J6D7T1_9ROSI|nr:hypothetical protein CXB51_004070 [Gossypium anomalum]
MQEFSLKSGANTPFLEVDVGDGSRLEADRITKKVRFKGGTDEEAIDMMVESGLSPKLSWKDKLLGTKSGVSDKEESGSSSIDSEEDIEILEGDIHRSIVNGIPAIDFSERIQHILFKEMERTVVLKLLGRNIGYGTLNNRIYSLWNPSKPFHLMDIKNRYFLAKFQSIDDYTKVLTQGPWLIYGQYLTVQPWTKEFSTSQPYPSTVLAWIPFPGLPGFLYKKKILEEIRGTIGKVVRLALNINNRIRGRFARMVVYINLDKLLIAQVLVNGMKQRVEYEALPTVCFTCGKYGHTKELCMALQSELPPEIDQLKVASIEAEKGGECADYGLWMMVERPLKSQKADIGPNGIMGMLTGTSVESYIADGPSSSRPSVAHSKNKESQATISEVNETDEPSMVSKSATLMPDLNCQGCASSKFLRAFREYNFEYRPDIVCLLEPRVSGNKVNFIIDKLGFDRSHRIESVGFSGGIWVGWKDFISISIIHNHPQFMLLRDLGFIGPSFTWQRGWTKQANFKDLVYNKWSFSGNMADSLSEFTSHVKYWNRSIYGHLGTRKRQLLKSLVSIQKAMDQSTSRRLANLEMEVRDELESVLNHEELLWRQKARCDWLQFGNRNTSFFYNRTMQRRKSNRILALRISNGEWCSDQSILSDEALKFFEKLYGEKPSAKSNPPFNFFSRLKEQDIDFLQKPVLNEEIKKALFNMAPLKAPRSDGFHAHFFQSQWDLVGGAVCEWVQGIFAGNKIEEALNNTLIVLILKMDRPEEFSQF